MEKEELEIEKEEPAVTNEEIEETSSWETLTEDDERYIEEHEEKEIALQDEKDVERPVINEEIANRVAEEEAKDMGPDLGMKFHAFWVSFGLPLTLMWAGLDAFMAVIALFQGNGGAIANVLIRGAVLFFGIPAIKGLRKFTRVSYIKHSTLCFYSFAVKVVNLVMVALNLYAAPAYVADVYAERSAEFASQGITEAMLLQDINMQFSISAIINIVTFVFWILLYRYYKKRRKYFTYK